MRVSRLRPTGRVLAVLKVVGYVLLALAFLCFYALIWLYEPIVN